MLTGREVEDLLRQARRNEVILQRLDKVDEFLLSRRGLAELLRGVCAHVAESYRLEAATLTLCRDSVRLQAALDGAEEDLAAGGVCTRPRGELRLLMVDLERPYLCNRVTRQLRRCFFPGPFKPASAAITPLWARGEFLGSLNLGSASAERFQPGYETHFLQRLGRKIAAGLDAGLVMEHASYMERRQAAVEMAGAACHQLAQPLTTAVLLVEKLKRLADDVPVREPLEELEKELERLGELVQRISQVSEYVTQPYAQGLRIIDLDAAGGPPDQRPETDNRG